MLAGMGLSTSAAGGGQDIEDVSCIPLSPYLPRWSCSVRSVKLILTFLLFLPHPSVNDDGGHASLPTRARTTTNSSQRRRPRWRRHPIIRSQQSIQWHERWSESEQHCTLNNDLDRSRRSKSRFLASLLSPSAPLALLLPPTLSNASHLTCHPPS
jgi:hypothetical protein